MFPFPYLSVQILILLLIRPIQIGQDTVTAQMNIVNTVAVDFNGGVKSAGGLGEVDSMILFRCFTGGVTSILRLF